MFRREDGVCFGCSLFVDVMLRFGEKDCIRFCLHADFCFDDGDVVRNR